MTEPTEATQTWQGKHPSEMSDEELRFAKVYVVERLGPVQDELNMLSAATQHLDAEINFRFKIGNYTQVNAVHLPEYPMSLGSAPTEE